jgi:hypothetical protein
MKKFYNFADMTFGYNYMVKSKNLNFMDKKLLFHTNEPTKIYSNISFTSKLKNKRNILMKLIFLLENNKIFEARDLINNNLKKDVLFFEIKKSINNLLILYKIKFIFLLPFYYLKKILKN